MSMIQRALTVSSKQETISPICRSHLLRVDVNFRMRHNTQIPLVRLCMFNHVQDLAGRRENSIFTVEHDCHLFQAMSSGFRVCEQYGKECDDEHDDENEIVFPCDA